MVADRVSITGTDVAGIDHGGVDGHIAGAGSVVDDGLWTVVTR